MGKGAAGILVVVVTACSVPEGAVGGMGSTDDAEDSGATAAADDGSSPGSGPMATTVMTGAGDEDDGGPAPPGDDGNDGNDTADGGDTAGPGGDSTGGGTTGDPPRPSCGDGHVDRGEACDLGAANADDGACTSTCQVATCGDGLVQAGTEECDLGGSASSECTATCQACDDTAEFGNGPIWSNMDAQFECPHVCDLVSGDWTGAWHTTIPNTFSVCECTDVCPDAAI